MTINKPNFFIVGMPRSGTSSMFTYLKQHPEIFLPIHKEPHFFSKDVNMHTNYVEKEELYYSLFRDAADKKAVGEASVWYLTSRVAAALIKDFNPLAKIIIMLRNPVDMMYSLHSLWVHSGNEDVKDFQQALALHEKRKKNLCLPQSCYFPPGVLYKEVAKYYDKVKRFLDMFGKEQLHFIIFDDFIASMAQVYKGTLSFLDVDPHFKAEFHREKAPKTIRDIVIKQLREAEPKIKAIMRYGIRKRAPETGNRPHPPLPPELRADLQKYFSTDIEKTSHLIGRDLTYWCRVCDGG